MPFYLMRFSYTPDAWARLIKKPEENLSTSQYLGGELGDRGEGGYL